MKKKLICAESSVLTLAVLLVTLFSSSLIAGNEGRDKRFHSLIYTKAISFDETLMGVIEKYDVGEKLEKRAWAIARAFNDEVPDYYVHAINYHTVDSNGNPLIASVVIYYPDLKRIRGVGEVSPVNKHRGACGSVDCYMEELLPCMSGYVCIIPDMIGYGSTDGMSINYIDFENEAIVSADFRTDRQSGNSTVCIFLRRIPVGFLYNGQIRRAAEDDT